MGIIGLSLWLVGLPAIRVAFLQGSLEGFLAIRPHQAIKKLFRQMGYLIIV